MPTGKEMCEAIVAANRVVHSDEEPIDPEALWNQSGMVWLYCAYQWAKFVLEFHREPETTTELLNYVSRRQGGD